MKKLFLIIILLLAVTTCFSQGDCPAQYMCAGANLTAVTDVTDELNGANQGCLSANEGNTSYWVQICALTAGTIEFTISPSGNNNDYDWAVWSGSTCPPTTSPIRCSFAISGAGPNGDNTGVSSTNNAPQTDNSEGAGGNQWTQDIIATAGACYIICINNYGPGSNNFGLSFGGTATLNCLPLPIELTSFTGQNNGYANILYWTTASETNNDYFTIERSTDAVTWTQIGEVDGASNSSQTIHYNFIDTKPNPGVNYYRIKQTDFNGQFEYYNIIAIETPGNNNSHILKTYDIMGQEVSNDYTGLRFIHYSDGRVVKKFGK